MRVLFLTHQYFPRHVGGTENLVRGLVERLVDRGDSVGVVSYVESASGDRKDFGPRRTEWEGVPLWEIHSNLSCEARPARAEYDNPLIAEWVLQIAFQFRADVIHAASLMKLGASVVARLKAEGFRVLISQTDYWPICLRHTLVKPDGGLCETGPDREFRCLSCAAATHGFAVPPTPANSDAELWTLAAQAIQSPEDSRFREDVLALAARKDRIRELFLLADRLVVLSEFQKREFVRHGFPAERLEVCCHGVGPEQFAPRREVAPWVTRQRKTLLFIGTLISQKGIHVLLEALTLVPGADVHVELIVQPGNDSSYNEQIQMLAASDPRVKLHGPIRTEEIPEALARADIFVLPSLGYENAPYVVKAALASGVPVAVSDLGSLTELVDEQSGWRLPVADRRAWATWLLEVAAAKSLPVPDVRSLPTAESFAQQIFAIYDDLASEGKQRAFYLVDRLDEARVQTPSPEYVQVQTFVIRRESRSTVFAHPPSVIIWPPIAVGSSPRLETFLGVKPSVWDRMGGPVRFRISCLDGAGTETPVYENDLDPRNKPEHRAWLPVSVDLSEHAGSVIRLKFETVWLGEDASYGWVGWGDPRVIFYEASGNPSSEDATCFERGDCERPDVFLITCDALRVDHVGCYGGVLQCTPNLDALAAEGVRVPHARAQTDTTMGSYVSLLTGRLPHETGVTAEWGGIPETMKTLPEFFAEQGYHTLFAPSEDEFGTERTGLAARFKEVIPCLGNPAQTAGITIRRVIDRLRMRSSNRQPWFVWIHLFEPHPPSMPEAELANQYWLGDPGLPYRTSQIQAIRAIETCLDFSNSEAALKRGQIPPFLLNRLEETVRCLRGRIPKGPDLVTHLLALGQDAWNGLPLPRFLAWLEAQVLHSRAEHGMASPALLKWLWDLRQRLSHSEEDLLAWLSEVKDVRYPLALYAATVSGVDREIGRLMRVLDDLGLRESAVVAFTAPHGEVLDEEVLIFEHHILSESVLRVPLLIKPSRKRPLPERSYDFLELSELGGVLMDAAGLAAVWPGADQPKSTSVSLGMQGVMACILRDGFKLVRMHAEGAEWPWIQTGPTGKFLLFGAEPNMVETTDLARQHPERVHELAHALEALIPEADAVRCMKTGHRNQPPMTTDVEASVIIVNFNGARYLWPCLESLRMTVGVSFEVIVVDNASKDGSPDLLVRDFPEVRVLKLGFNAGFGEANRRGAKIARGKHLVFLNNDTVVQPEWLEALVRAMADPTIGSACSTLVYIDEPHLYNARGICIWRLGFARERDARQLIASAPEVPEFWETLAPTGASMIIRKEEFFEMGGFDPAMFMYFEDVDLGWRLWLAGRRVVNVSSSLVLHHGSATTRKKRTLRWKHSVGYRHLIRTILKCYEWRQLFRALKWHFRILKREGDWGMLASVLWWNLRHLPSTLIARAKIQKSRLCSDRQIFDRGLFETEDMAPPLDVVSCVDRLSTRTKPASSRVLMTGQLSADSRLGEGWHLPECMFGQSVRWTNGPARACLQVNANECGRVRVELRLPQPLVKNRQITVSCNTVKESREVDAMPQSFVLPVVADAHGRLEILIEAPTWTPKQVESWNRDTRNLGCVVTEIRFESETSTNIWAPVSASLLITGRSQNLQNILTNLASEPCQPGEVFVIDKQESVPGSEPRTFPFRVEFLSNDRDDPTDSMLRALESVTGDVVIFLSAEHVVEPGFVKAHLDAQKAAGEPCVVLGACGLERRKIRSRPFQKWIGKRPSLTSADLSLANDGLFARLAGVNLSMARCLLEEHPVDPRFDVQGWSIFELCYRLSAHGIPFFTSAEARIRQAPNVKTWMIRMQTLGNQFALLQKVHPELRELILTELGQRPLPSWFRFLARPVHAGVWDWFDDLRLPLPSWFYRGVRDAAFLYGSEAPAKRLNKSSVLSRATE